MRNLIKSGLLVLALSMGVAGCGGVETIVIDPLGQFAPMAAVSYADSQDFDSHLYKSLTGMGDVKVTFPSATTLPSRLNLWKSKLEKAGGTVAVCDTVTGAGGLPFDIPGIPSFVTNELYELARAQVLYKPTANFNAVVEYYSSDNDFTAIRFVAKSTDLASVKAGYGSCK